MTIGQAILVLVMLLTVIPLAVAVLAGVIVWLADRGVPLPEALVRLANCEPPPPRR